MLALANVFHFFAHEFAGMSGGSLALSFIAAGPFDGLPFRHGPFQARWFVSSRAAGLAGALGEGLADVPIEA